MGEIVPKLAAALSEIVGIGETALALEVHRVLAG
jgi:hypothetical protein